MFTTTLTAVASVALAVSADPVQVAQAVPSPVVYAAVAPATPVVNAAPATGTPVVSYPAGTIIYHSTGQVVYPQGYTAGTVVSSPAVRYGTSTCPNGKCPYAR